MFIDKENKELKLSACLIVKNEESNLHRCLSSIVKVVDEIIIVDTGSTDKTVEIAESYGAKVFGHPWEDDFSKHRNQSLSYATGDWLFVIDADEEFAIADTHQTGVIKDWLVKQPDNVVSVSVILKDIKDGMVNMQFNSARFFRKGTVEYKGVIHNKPHIKGEMVLFPQAYLFHYGYDLTTAQKKAKAERTISLLEQRLTDTPDDYEAIFFLTQAYSWHGRHGESVRLGERYVALRQMIGEKFSPSVYFTLCISYRRLENQKKCRKWLLAGLELYPKDIDLLFALMNFGLWVEDMDLMAKGARHFIDAYYSFDPQKRGGHFTYKYTPEALALCISNLAVAQLQEGMHTLNKLHEVMPLLPKESRKELVFNVERLLRKSIPSLTSLEDSIRTIKHND